MTWPIGPRPGSSHKLELDHEHECSPPVRINSITKEVEQEMN